MEAFRSTQLSVKSYGQLLRSVGLLALGYLWFSLRTKDVLGNGIPIFGAVLRDPFYIKTKRRFAQDAMAIVKSGLKSGLKSVSKKSDGICTMFKRTD